jgi:D-alanyl-D-alanine dipeptidase
MLSATSQDEIILIADPRILQIPIHDNGEDMIDLKSQTEITYGPSPEIPNNQDYTKLRKTVYNKLRDAQASLPKGLRFCIYEGYRSLSLQEMLFEARFLTIKNLQPTWSYDQIFDETIKLVSPITNKDGSQNIPPHSTGGAVDIYLVTEDGEAIDMGIHPQDWMQDTEGQLSLTESLAISSEARLNRQIMGNALKAVGFINYPTEYWHWSYGDRYWAYFRNFPAALYGNT